MASKRIRFKADTEMAQKIIVDKYKCKLGIRGSNGVINYTKSPKQLATELGYTGKAVTISASRCYYTPDGSRRVWIDKWQGIWADGTETTETWVSFEIRDVI